jgi:hypothetical protein
VEPVVAVMAGIRQARGQRGRSEEGRGNQKLCLSHLDSPEIPLRQPISADSSSI